MRRFLARCIAVCALINTSVFAQTIPDAVAAALKDAGIPQAAVSIIVQPVGGGAPMVNHQATQTMNPASTMKLLTTYAALELLGPAYTWRTEVYANKVVDERVPGDLYLKGYGDPKFTMEQFWLLLRSLRQRGVREIAGNLVVDDSYFELPAADPASFDAQGLRAYNVLPKAVLPSFKAVSFRFVPDVDERVVRIYSEPDLKPVRVINRVTLKDGACPFDWRESVQREVTAAAQAATVTFTGSYVADCGERELGLAVLENNEFVAAMFRQYWTELGGTFKGNVVAGTVPGGAKLLISRASPPLSELIRDVNKWSNNVMARQLFLTLGAQQGGAPGNLSKADAAVRRWLAGRSLNFTELVLENGAGLSRIERLSARHLADLLAIAAIGPYAAEFEASLPIVGVDGTLKRRVVERPVAGKGHIKTGSLEGVRTIAGYVLDAAGRKMIVVFLVNHARAGGAQAAQDALLEWVYGRL